MTTGFVLVDKPRGPSSHDIVDMARRAFGVKRIGHAGTLDPPASGLLVLAVGPATRLLRYVQHLVKTYEVTGVLGIRTTTLDAEGEVTSRQDANIAPDVIRATALGFVGDIEQKPPAVSAIKVGGERAYKKAARGEDVDLAARPVTVYSFDVLRTSPNAFDGRVVCSSGTYIRSLVADLGDKIGCGAHVGLLRRTAIGDLSVADACGPDQFDASRIRPVQDILPLPHIEIDGETEGLARNGRSISRDVEGEALVMGPGGVVGVFEGRDGILRPVTVLGGG